MFVARQEFNASSRALRRKFFSRKRQAQSELRFSVWGYNSTHLD